MSVREQEGEAGTHTTYTVLQYLLALVVLLRVGLRKGMVAPVLKSKVSVDPFGPPVPGLAVDLYPDIRVRGDERVWPGDGNGPCSTADVCQ